MTAAATSPGYDVDDNMARVEDFELFMRPIVRILLMFRVSMPAFIALVKKLYLEEAKKKLERRKEDVSVPKLAFEAGCRDIGLVSDFIKGRRTTIADIGDLPQAGGHPDAVPLLSLEGIILDRWRSDPLYQDEQGQPISLPVRGPAGRSFDGLVRRCVSGRMSYGPILETLKRTKSIKHDTDTDEVSMVPIDPKSPEGKEKGYSPGALANTALYLRSDDDSRTQAKIGERMLLLGIRENRNLRSVFESAVRSIAHLAGVCSDNLLLVAEGRPNREIFNRTQMEYLSFRIPADKYWELKAHSIKVLVGAVDTWTDRVGREIEAPKGPNQITAGIGVYFWDTRPNVYDTDDIGMPEILDT